MEEQEQIKQQVEQPTEQGSSAKKKSHRLTHFMRGDVLQSRFVTKQIWLILLCGFYALLLVFNRYRIEGLNSQKMEVQERINYLREARIELQKGYQESVKISQVAERLEGTGVGITAGPPYEI